MSVRSAARSVAHSVARWVRRARARRRARLASLSRVDERLMEVSRRARDAGESYDTWRQALPVPRRGTGLF